MIEMIFDIRGDGARHADVDFRPVGLADDAARELAARDPVLFGIEEAEEERGIAV